MLTLTLWPINCGVLTSLLLLHLSSSLKDSLPCLNLLCYSKTDARFMQDGRKAVWSIPCVPVAFFRNLKQNFIAYRSSKVSSRPDCIFEIHQLWQSGFSRVYFNCYCSCWFEPEIIKIGQSSHKMYSQNLLNFQESTTILNAHTKKFWKLIECPWRNATTNENKIRTLAENETYKYLGILEADTIKQVEMKNKIQKEYLRRTRKLLETKLSSRKLIKGINTWAVPLVRYSGPFLKWTRNEAGQMDQRTRKPMTMHQALHPRDDVDRLYASRKEGGRGLASIADSVDASIQWLEDYIENRWGRLITTTRNNTDNTGINRTEITRNKNGKKNNWTDVLSD